VTGSEPPRPPGRGPGVLPPPPDWDGGICWIDLGTPDIDTTASFYTALLGWDIGPPDAIGYRLATLDGHLVAALGPAEEPGPPYWTVYAATPDADAAARAATAAGGTLLVPPAPAGQAGVAAAVRGPAGAPLSLWQARDHPGTWISRHHGALAGVQLRTSQPAAHARFLRAVLGWNLEGAVFTVHGTPVASWAPPMRALAHPPSPWLVRFHVDDTASAVRQAVSLGARELDEPGTLTDPSGTLLALAQLDRPDRPYPELAGALTRMRARSDLSRGTP
jgi:predicted enzyme related to lactoylglutathione lyase